MSRAIARPTLLSANLVLVLTACGGGAVATDAEPPSHPAGHATSSPDATLAATATTAATETVAATESVAPTESASDGPEIVLSNKFLPDELTIAAGTTVTFRNVVSARHTVTHGTEGKAQADALFDTNLPGGNSIQITFDEPGTYDITCVPHPFMQMQIVVEG